MRCWRYERTYPNSCVTRKDRRLAIAARPGKRGQIGREPVSVGHVCAPVTDITRQSSTWFCGQRLQPVRQRQMGPARLQGVSSIEAAEDPAKRMHSTPQQTTTESTPSPYQLTRPFQSQR